MAIVIKKATKKPIENDSIWSFPVEELDYLLETAEDGASYLLWEGRLYEVN